jgi:hypothetical protein
MDIMEIFTKGLELATQAETLLTGCMAILGYFLNKKHREAGELTKVLDKCDIDNEKLHELSRAEGLFKAGGQILKLLNKK